MAVGQPPVTAIAHPVREYASDLRKPEVETRDVIDHPSGNRAVKLPVRERQRLYISYLCGDPTVAGQLRPGCCTVPVTDAAAVHAIVKIKREQRKLAHDGLSSRQQRTL